MKERSNERKELEGHVRKQKEMLSPTSAIRKGSMMLAKTKLLCLKEEKIMNDNSVRRI